MRKYSGIAYSMEIDVKSKNLDKYLIDIFTPCLILGEYLLSTGVVVTDIYNTLSKKIDSKLNFRRKTLIKLHSCKSSFNIEILFDVNTSMTLATYKIRDSCELVFETSHLFHSYEPLLHFPADILLSTRSFEEFNMLEKFFNNITTFKIEYSILSYLEPSKFSKLQTFMKHNVELFEIFEKIFDKINDSDVLNEVSHKLNSLRRSITCVKYNVVGEEDLTVSDKIIEKQVITFQLGNTFEFTDTFHIRKIPTIVLSDLVNPNSFDMYFYVDKNSNSINLVIRYFGVSRIRLNKLFILRKLLEKIYSETFQKMLIISCRIFKAMQILRELV